MFIKNDSEEMCNSGLTQSKGFRVVLILRDFADKFRPVIIWFSRITGTWPSTAMFPYRIPIRWMLQFSNHLSTLYGPLLLTTSPNILSEESVIATIIKNLIKLINFRMQFAFEDVKKAGFICSHESVGHFCLNVVLDHVLIAVGLPYLIAGH